MLNFSENYQKNQHFADLMASYKAVGDGTWLANDFSATNLESSRSLFTPESLQGRIPKPKSLEVFALLAGLSFPNDFTDKLVAVQLQISEILVDCLHYWVSPANMGVEYCVFKWPTDQWRTEWSHMIHETLASIKMQPFLFNIIGVQINPDGCVVARGFDENAELFRIRSLCKNKIPFLPTKQSNWAHVPLGRILEPIGSKKFVLLARLIDSMAELLIASTKIINMKFIHETCWYMEEKTILREYLLVNANNKEKVL